MRCMSEFVTLREAAELKGVHYQTVRRAIARGDLDATRVGRAVLVRPEALAQWLPLYNRAPSRHIKRAADGY